MTPTVTLDAAELRGQLRHHLAELENIVTALRTTVAFPRQHLAVFGGVPEAVIPLDTQPIVTEGTFVAWSYPALIFVRLLEASLRHLLSRAVTGIAKLAKTSVTSTLEGARLREIIGAAEGAQAGLIELCTAARQGLGGDDHLEFMRLVQSIARHLDGAAMRLAAIECQPSLAA